MLFVVNATFLLGCSDEKLKGIVADTNPVIPETVAIEILDYCPRPNYHFQDIWGLGMSYKISGGGIVPDFDRDGVQDGLDNNGNLNISRLNRDTNGDGYSDLLIFQAGMQVEDQVALSHLVCDSSPTNDEDLDGLTDCEEENLAHTDPEKWDTDGDRIPDSIEIRFGLNPADPDDAEQNLAGDGILNLKKIKDNIPIYEKATEFETTHGFKYSIVPNDTRGVGCVDITISNIPQVPVSNGNLVNIYISEDGLIYNPGSGRSVATKALRTISLVTEQLEAEQNPPFHLQYKYEPTVDANWSVQE